LLFRTQRKHKHRQGEKEQKERTCGRDGGRVSRESGSERKKERRSEKARERARKSEKSERYGTF
jgi:hypothetical protein